jgi:DNA (cytosine-5)-methyltransferase 1
MGYHQAGFDVVGVDIKAQPRYPFKFIQDDALSFVSCNGHEYDAIHASPPCQGYSKARNLQGNAHPMLVDAVRQLLRASGKPYVIENVQGAPLLDPVLLVGSMFGLRTMRPRLFECSFPVPFMLAPPASARHAKMGRPPKEGEYVHVVGHMSNVPYCGAAMGIDWMNQSELAQAIPPAYTRFIAEHLMAHLQGVTAMLPDGNPPSLPSLPSLRRHIRPFGAQCRRRRGGGLRPRGRAPDVGDPPRQAPK